MARWSEVVPTLRGIARPLFSAVTVLGERDGKLAIGTPNEAHRTRSSAHVAELEAAVATIVGATVSVLLVVDGAADPEGLLGDSPMIGAGSAARVVPLKARAANTSVRRDAPDPGVVADAEGESDLGAAADQTAPDQHTDESDEAIDMSALTDVPPESVLGPVDRLLQAFPGSQEMDER
ncbi:MAG: dnaX [Ilumatobacteraceae bacterium]|nr:dnaX [Ilumatobacteraceae bacterium]